MASIKKSVGKKGKNENADTKIIQAMLNNHAKNAGFSKIKVDGLCGKRSIAAITTFQKYAGMRTADGTVDPGKATFKALNNSPKKVAAEQAEAEAATSQAKEKAKEEKSGSSPAKGKGKLSGPLNGVASPLNNALQAVADHYGVPIVVLSGKRVARSQAKAMWDGWKSNLKEGEFYPELKRDRERLKKLQEAYNNRDFLAFEPLVMGAAKKISKHVDGGAVDIKKSTDKRAVKALAMMFHHIPERSCHHFDTSKNRRVPPDRWPR